MSEDIQKDPDRPRRRRPRDEDADDRDLDYAEEPPFPAMVRTAGAIWIGYGCLILLNTAAVLVFVFVLASQMHGDAAAGAVGGGVCVSVLIGLFGAAFLFVGVQSVRGTARDTLGNGIGSIIFGVLQLGGVALYAATGQPVQAGVAALGGGLLLVAGILALVGRTDYRRFKDWQRAQKKRELMERKARRREREG